MELSNKNEEATNEQIRDAYKDKDADASRKLHDTKLTRLDSNNPDNEVLEVPMEEQHKALGDYVKSIIYGGLDGIITTFAIVAGIAGADLTTDVILVLGFANLIADGLSMGIGDYLSEVSEIEYINSEKEREEWEFDNFKEGEIQEMIEIYKEKGVSQEDAEVILRTMSKYPEFFINHMMIQELELQPPSGDEQPAKGGLVTLISFLCFGCVPLLSYVAFEAIEFDGYDPKFLISIILTILTLFGLGVFKGKITESSMIKSGLFITINGVFAAGAA
eukprot:CAMPEP_0201591922 /NCGR_PEP_ID=MMETSP0190_2-20130828/189958_1 /ASSEMBLY_ACC=CAM_ASM_000263 /TAXON_ID=37353 /ORGANISM="Rosalina sp." /LENGTH=275 /DNA_ID=CAMNT_0048050461 /DNA_START=32 /DNA_END=859 /DNA_ORIENTATION=+